ncbi:MlaE family ABC transporter permease [Candidatus Dependentiae bacterium]
MVLKFFDYVGQKVINTCESAGAFVIFLGKVIVNLFSTKLKISKLFTQMARIGSSSISVVALTGASSGMAFALQTYIGFRRVGGEHLIGAIVALGMIRELGPVLTGLMVTGRAGSAITAEIGTMQITEQVDALRTLRINIFQYLMVPRILAGIIVLPLLALFTMICGIVGGYVVCVYALGLSPEDYTAAIRSYVEMSDIMGGLIKSSVFGLILTWVGTYKGYRTYGGARGVGAATTRSVVMSSIMILVTNYFLTKVLENL